MLEHFPEELRPVLAKVKHDGCNGHNEWYEVVYLDETGWKSYAGSSTFNDGEQVLDWKYCKDIL